MALGALGVLFCLIIILSILSILTVTIKKGALLNKFWILILVVMYCLVLSYLNFTAVPTNFIISKVISVLFALCSIAALGLRSLKNNDFKLSQLLLIISILGNTIQLWFF